MVADSHRAAALRLAWARHQLAGGRKVWPSPAILPWDAWLARQWRAAVLRGATTPLQLLSPGQERALWDEVLRELAGDGMSLAAHAGGLIRAAGRATQSLLPLSRSALSDEEKLLVRALTEVRQRCSARGLLSLRLAPPAALQFLRDVDPPAIAGEPRLTALQEALCQQCWDGAELLLPEPSGGRSTTTLRRCGNLDAELAACARWCMERLRQSDGSARLLVLSACPEPSVAIQGELLWRHLAGSGPAPMPRNRLLAVEGGVPLLDIGPVAAGVLALECMEEGIDTGQLFALLRSPYFQFGSQTELCNLRSRLERWALARWSVDALIEALSTIAGRDPAGARLHAWLTALRASTGSGERRSASAWALLFHEALTGAGFDRREGADSRELQQFARWGELLDEFSSLDAVVTAMPVSAALDALRRIAAASRHEAASGDAAVTFSLSLGDPVAGYDGIWVLGLAENRWPAPPRPDAYVAVQEQRSARWPESSAAERRWQGEWALSRWQLRTSELVLSFPEMEADLRHRPAALPGLTADWLPGDPPVLVQTWGMARQADDQQFPPITDLAPEQLLRGGIELLRNQHLCPFRAQAQWRLAAHSPGPLSDGLTAPQRGTLLHALLQAVWGELGDQQQLLALTPHAEHALLDRHWRAVIAGGVVPARWWSPALRERERERTLQLVAGLLQLERGRAPFAVVARELGLHWPPSGPQLRLRIDRIDRTAEGTRVLIDYKSGSAETIRLQEGELHPLQLAAYVAALAARGEPVSAAALLSLDPHEPEFRGVTAAEVSAPPGLRSVEEWSAMSGQWQQQLLELLGAYLEGAGTLASERASCRYCHLPGLCRRAAVEDLESGDE